MNIFLAMAVFAATTSAPVQDLTVRDLTVRDLTVQDLTVQDLTVQDLTMQETQIPEPSTAALICTAAGARVSGATKVCYYKCAGKEGAFTTRLYEHCPSWTPRWRLKDHNRQFGPSGLSRK